MRHSQYKDISKDFSRSAKKLVVEHNININIMPEDIVALFHAFGGDHWQGLFQLCCCFLLKVRGKEIPYYKTKAITEVYCKKEEGTMLN